MNAINRREDFLASALLEAVVDEDWSSIQILVQKHRASGTRLVQTRGIAAIHYAAGMEEFDFGLQVIELIVLDAGADVNIRTEEGETALHIASFWGRIHIVKLLLKHGASIEMIDHDNNTAISHAIESDHFELVDIFKRFAFEQKIARKKSSASLLAVPSERKENQLTPKRIPYNFDSTSPFFIHITHRGNRMQRLNEFREKPVTNKNTEINLFQLTEDNVHEFTQRQAQEKSERFRLIDRWRERVDPIMRSIQSDQRESLLPEDIDDLDKIVESFSTNLPREVALKETEHKAVCEDVVIVLESSSEEEAEEIIDQSNFIRSPRPDAFVIQITERYMHEDGSNGVKVYENKVRSQAQSPSPSRHHHGEDNNDDDADDAASSAVSTEYTIPLHYDTDDLRMELTQFGAQPGPILKTTKRLYLKKLMRLKRNANRSCFEVDGHRQKAEFSYELTRTMMPDTWQIKLAEYAVHITALTDSFRLQKTERQALREGHLKTSFVYLLIDPRIAENLVADSKEPSFSTWETFVRSIFYVGKGKNSRPFAHLYDAIKVYERNNKIAAPTDRVDNDPLVPPAIPLAPNTHFSRRLFIGESSTANPTQASEPTIVVSTKIERILNIWATGKGVICLQVFRNIIPSEAFTREAAIIDAIGLTNLTNVKGGDYYGRVKGWRIRDRKQLGVALLYNALLVMLADGESQLRPDDLF